MGWPPTTHQDVQDAVALLRTATAVRIYSSVGTTVPAGTVTAIAQNSEDFDPFLFHDVVTNNDRLTVPVGYDGTYVILGQIAYPSSSSSDMHAILRKNTTIDLAEGQLEGAASTATKVLVVSIEQLAAGDFVNLLAYQNTSGSVVTQAGRTVTYLTMGRIGA